jgi:hypothetical protein
MPDAALALFSDARSLLLVESLEASLSVKEIPWVIKGTVGLYLFFLNSAQNDVMAGDEDPISGNGNPHPEHHQQNEGNGNGNQFPWFFEAVQDLDEVHQENVNQG